ncbi:E3 ubiquitin-protein ligase MIB2, partial [Elysia marginata]
HGADIEIRNNRHQTPLLLAVSQGHTCLLELLVSRGARVNVTDEDGDTCLHLALMRQTVATEKDGSPMLDAIRSQLNLSEGEDQTGAAIACYLAQHGAELRARNNQGKTPMDIITDPKIEEVVKQFATVFIQKQAPPMKPAAPECDVCLNPNPLVTFQPCGHSVVCEECCIKMKKCIECKAIIDFKKTRDGRVIKSEQPSHSEEVILKKRLQELEDTVICPICMERQRSSVFLCGHATCGQCADSLKNCPICRRPIKHKINLF